MASRAHTEPQVTGRPEGLSVREHTQSCKRGQPWSEAQAGVRFVRKAVPIDDHAPAVVQRLLGQLASLVSGELMAYAQLLMSELVRQRVGRREGDRRDELWIDISLTPDRLRVAVIDPDHTDAIAAPAPHRELQLVAELADRWGVRHNTTTTIWFELDQ
jgi:hypothetical protein